MPDTLLLLRLEHVNTGKLLTLLELECQRMLTNGGPDHALLGLMLEYFLGFPDECHHPKEDLIFRKMQTRDPRAAERVGNLLGEHEELARVTRSMARLAEKARLNSSVTREELADALRGFMATYRHHLLAEEETFFPAALSTLTEDDWAAIDFGTFDQRDPLFDDMAEGRFRELNERIWATAADDGGPTERAQGE